MHNTNNNIGCINIMEPIAHDVEKFILYNKLYKLYTLVLCRKYNLPTLNTVAILSYDEKILNKCIKIFPFLLRFDFQTLPRKKYLGGIIIYNKNIIYELFKRLLDEKYVPLLSEPVHRLEDLYSIGCLISQNIDDVVIEIVGTGFDASDLRLGDFVPHEIIEYNIRENYIINRSVIDDDKYKEQITLRKIKIAKLKIYEEIVNKEGRLLNSEEFNQITIDHKYLDDVFIPPKYRPIGNKLLNELIDLCRDIKMYIIPKLPKSKSYIVSITYTYGRRWIIWDIYGGWYKR